MTEKQNTLSLHSLELWVSLGWGEEERLQKQKVMLDISFYFPEELSACKTDDLADTFCYDTLISSIHDYVSEKSFRLIEKLSCDLYHFIKQQIPQSVLISLRATKKPAIASLTGGVSFCYGDIKEATWSF